MHVIGAAQKVHARVKAAGGGEKTVKEAYMTLPPSLCAPSIADSCLACFDYTVSAWAEFCREALLL